jgi:selenocysteine lyase/cysteine desulfurase
MCIRLKEALCTDRTQQRERELLHIIFDRLPRIPGIQVLAPHATERLGVVSFVVEGAHYNLVVRLLNDRFGIQLRGGCSCAGTYGHLLMKVDEATSYMIRDAIRSGDLQQKPGWVRLSIHPVMTDKELHYILDAIAATVDNMAAWEKDYCYDAGTNEYQFSGDKRGTQVQHWFERF